MNFSTLNLSKKWIALLNNWNEFWFKKEAPLNLALMRIVLVGTMLYIYILRIDILDNFGQNSMVPRELALKMYTSFVRPGFAWFFWPDSWVYIIHSIFIFLLVLAFLGLSNRALMIITWVLHMGFVQRNYTIQFGGDIISGILFFYLSFTNCCDRLSLKNLIFKNKSKNEETGRLWAFRKQFNQSISSVFYRMIQIQISVIYAYTGFEKMKGGSWWDGTALWTVLANPQFAAFDLTWLRHMSLFLIFGSFITIIFEVYFPVMIIHPKTRYYWLGLGALFHLLIGVFMALGTFSLIMMSTYFLFIAPETLEWIKKQRLPISILDSNSNSMRFFRK